MTNKNQKLRKSLSELEAIDTYAFAMKPERRLGHYEINKDKIIFIRKNNEN